jgi:hypothetical protein
MPQQTAILARPITAEDLLRLVGMGLHADPSVIARLAPLLTGDRSSAVRMTVDLACPTREAAYILVPASARPVPQHRHGGRRHGHLTPAEETTFMADLLHEVMTSDARIDLADVRRRLVRLVGHSVSSMMVCRLLKRHGWVRINAAAYRGHRRPSCTRTRRQVNHE